MRLVEVTIPGGKRDAVLGTLDDAGIDYVVTDEVSGREYTALVTFPLPTEAVEPVLDELRNAVVNDGETAATARDATAAELQTLRSALCDNAVTDEAVRTTYFRLEPIYDFGGDRRELVVFRASHGVEIEIAPRSRRRTDRHRRR